MKITQKLAHSTGATGMTGRDVGTDRAIAYPRGVLGGIYQGCTA
ncbi:hypothetical protein Q7C18_11545 [Nesterenkonia sp. CL21]|nr:hypothetical protein [Nesterenkonia sp. CL21]MDS2173336.1 hypothetical protein [Nesterenkonia sp. CL21]